MKSMRPEIIIHITPEGIAPPEIQVDTEPDQLALEQLLDRIRPCLDVAVAIIRKTDPGAQG